MKHLSVKRFIPLILMAGFTFFESQAITGIKDTIKNPFNEKRIYTTTKLKNSVPKIDGVADDDCWLKEGCWSENYKHFIPEEGAQPTAETEIKILYDESNIYVAIRAYDDPELIDGRRGRRDDFSGIL